MGWTLAVRLQPNVWAGSGGEGEPLHCLQPSGATGLSKTAGEGQDVALE